MNGSGRIKIYTRDQLDSIRSKKAAVPGKVYEGDDGSVHVGTKQQLLRAAVRIEDVIIDPRDPSQTLRKLIESISASAAQASAYQDKVRRHLYNGSYSYCGTAPAGTAESSPQWKIKRILVASNGTTTITTATNVSWTNVLTATYT